MLLDDCQNYVTGDSVDIIRQQSIGLTYLHIIIKYFNNFYIFILFDKTWGSLHINGLAVY